MDMTGLHLEAESCHSPYAQVQLLRSVKAANPVRIEMFPKVCRLQGLESAIRTHAPSCMAHSGIEAPLGDNDMRSPLLPGPLGSATRAAIGELGRRLGQFTRIAACFIVKTSQYISAPSFLVRLQSQAVAETGWPDAITL